MTITLLLLLLLLAKTNTHFWLVASKIMQCLSCHYFQSNLTILRYRWVLHFQTYRGALLQRTSHEVKEGYWDKWVCVRGLQTLPLQSNLWQKSACNQRRYFFLVQVYQGRHNLTHIWPVLRASYKSSWFTTPPLRNENERFIKFCLEKKNVRRRCTKSATKSKNRALLDTDVTICTGREISGSLPAGVNKYCITLHLWESILVKHSYK